MNKELSKVMHLWDEARDIISSRFGIETHPEPLDIRETDEELFRRRGWFSTEDSTFVTKCLSNIDEDILRGVVLRECMIASLPDNIIYEAKRDIGYEFAFQNLSKRGKSKWMTLWNELPKIMIRPNLRYSSTGTMKWRRDVIGEKHLEQVVREFTAIAKYGIRQTFEEYVEYLTQRMQNATVHLENAEVQILSAAMEDSDAGNQKIAEKTGYSPQWVSTVLSRLTKRHVFIEQEWVPYSKLKLDMIHILLEKHASIDGLNYFRECPFLFDLRNAYGGLWDYLVSLTVPENTKSLRAIDEILKILAEDELNSYVFNVHSAIIDYSFMYYDTTKFQWNIPWDVLKLWIKRIHFEGLEETAPTITRSATIPSIDLDSIDMRIISAIEHKIFTLKEMREKLQIGQNKLTRRLQRLRKAKMIQTRRSARTIGLVENVMFITPENRFGKIVDFWSRTLPKKLLRYNSEGEFQMISDLPLGGTYGMMKALEDMENEYSIIPLSKSMGIHWKLPIHTWDEDRQRWGTPTELIEQWFDSLYDF